MRALSDEEVEKRDCTICTDYRAEIIQRRGYHLQLHRCKHSEGCPYAAHFSNEDSFGVKKRKKRGKKK